MQPTLVSTSQDTLLNLKFALHVEMNTVLISAVYKECVEFAEAWRAVGLARSGRRVPCLFDVEEVVDEEDEEAAVIRL